MLPAFVLVLRLQLSWCLSVLLLQGLHRDLCACVDRAALLHPLADQRQPPPSPLLLTVLQQLSKPQTLALAAAQVHEAAAAPRLGAAVEAKPGQGQSPAEAP
jgi:hypothetical protein